MTTDASTTDVASEPAPSELKPAQVKAQTKFNAELAPVLARTNDKLGATLEVQSDFTTFKEADWASQSLYSRGAEVLNGIVRVSQDAAYKDELVKRLKAVSLTFNGQPGSALEYMQLRDGVLSFAMHKTHNNLAELTYKLLKKALDE